MSPKEILKDMEAMQDEACEYIRLFKTGICKD